jgi:hypothetical protein
MEFALAAGNDLGEIDELVVIGPFRRAGRIEGRAEGDVRRLAEMGL